MISLDTETTGLDLRHGARPFFVTVCKEDGEQLHWEWNVDPLTREVDVPDEDVTEIRELIEGNELVLQNAKFDAAALATIGIVNWPWERTNDTLIAGHLLASNQPHNLTDMAMQYLGIDIEPYEKALERVVKEARRIAKKEFPMWRLARKDDPDMPSAKEKTWKYDSWLPRALWRTDCEEINEQYQTVLADYANADSATTLALWNAQHKELERRGLMKLYKERMRVLPVAVAMEARGITVSKVRLDELRDEFRTESERAGAVCVNIAADHVIECPDCKPVEGPARLFDGLKCSTCDGKRRRPYELRLPKSGNNKSLAEFVFNHLKLPVLEYTEGGAPSINKAVLERYLAELPPRSTALTFVRNLTAKRKRDTAINYLDGYERYWMPMYRGTNLAYMMDWKNWYRLHPNLNPCGTDTLRWSSNNPNEQNFSKQEGFNLRYALGPAPGREWWSLDAKNIELRIPAYESGERDMIELFERPDDPPYYGSTHLLNFHTVYPDVWDKELKAVGEDGVGPQCKKKYAASYYQWCKNGNFAIQYGAGEATADRAFHRPGSHARLKTRFIKLAQLNSKWIAFAEKHGYVETMPDKTVDPSRGYPLLCTRSERGGILPTIPLCYHVSGTAMWCTMKAMIRCHAKLEQWRAAGFDGHLIMQVHDELVFDFPLVKVRVGKELRLGKEPANLWRIRVLQKLMAQGGDDIGVPTPVGAEYHDESWSKGVTI